MTTPNSHPVSVSYVIRSQAGVRRRLPSRVITQGQWSAIRYGGFADFTLETSAAFTDLASIVATDILEVSLNGVLSYRGEVTSRRRAKGEPDTLTLAGYGRMMRVGGHYVQKRYAKYGGIDIALQFRDMVKEWVQPFEPGLAVRVLPIGQTVDLFDAWGQKVKDATDTLIGLSANQAVWGVDVITDPADAEYLADRLYMRPVSSGVDWVLPSSSRVGTSSESEQNSEQVVNLLYVFGGPPKYPNLLYNGDFERPTFAGNGLGNLLQNPGFEDGTNHWAFSGGASVKPTGHLEGASFSGGSMVELDHAGESVSQTTTSCPANRDIIFATHARRELQDVVVSGTMKLDFLDGGGSVLATSTFPPVSPPGTLWEYYYQPARSPSGTARCRLTVTLDSITTPGHGGLILDDLEVYDAGNVLQDRWGVTTFGAAAVVAQNWLYPDAFHGGYSVFLQQTSQDADGHDSQLGLTNGGRIDVTPDQELRFGVWLKLPPGVSSCGKMLLEIHSFDGSGKDQGFATKQVIAPQSWTGWRFFSATHGFAGDSAKASCYLTFRGDGAIIADAFCVRDSAAYTADSEFFIPEGVFQTVIRAADAFAGDATPVGSAIAASASLYGERADVVNEPSLTTLADALSYARAVFQAKALPPLSPTVERIDDPRAFRPGQTVVLAGAEGQALEQQQTLPIVKATWTHTGPLRVKLTLERELSDPGANILQQIQKRLAMGGLTSGGGTGGTSSGSSGATGGQAVPYVLPPATTTDLGGVIAGSGTTIDADGTIHATAANPYTLPPATASALGGVKIGANISVAPDGTISAAAPGGSSYTLPPATTTALGGVKVGSGLNVAGDGTLSTAPMTYTAADGTSIVSQVDASQHYGASLVYTVTDASPNSPGSYQTLAANNSPTNAGSGRLSLSHQRFVNATASTTITVTPQSGDGYVDVVNHTTPSSITIAAGHWADFYSDGVSKWYVIRQ